MGADHLTFVYGSGGKDRKDGRWRPVHDNKRLSRMLHYPCTVRREAPYKRIANASPDSRRSLGRDCDATRDADECDVMADRRWAGSRVYVVSDVILYRSSPTLARKERCVTQTTHSCPKKLFFIGLRKVAQLQASR